MCLVQFRTKKVFFEIRGDITIIFIDRPYGEIIEAIIDTEDLENVKSFNNSWGIKKFEEIVGLSRELTERIRLRKIFF